MKDSLTLNLDNYVAKSVTVGKQIVNYRAYEGLCYCKAPLDAIQTLNIYIPEAYYHNESIGKYDAKNAPYFVPNAVGGYMAGPTEQPGVNPRTKLPNSLFVALQHGLIVCSIGVRGRNTGKVSNEFFEGSIEKKIVNNNSKMVGRAPAFIVDYKAGIRYLRHNKDVLPGNLDRIITNGTSAGGALSALAGASGNHPWYESYLKQIGAADERDDIFAASCYCPIHNLEHADMAYEWEFCGENTYHRTKHQRTSEGIIRIPDNGQLTVQQIESSKQLKRLFPSYVNALNLKTKDGNACMLDEDGNGSFQEYVKSFIIQSANEEVSTQSTKKNLSHLMVAGSEVEKQDFFIKDKDQIIDLDWQAYVHAITRMKPTPAFDSFDLKSPENEVFGDEVVPARHFTSYAMKNNQAENAEMADEKLVKMMNPVAMMDDNQSNVAQHWRIRHGSYDRDTSFAIPVILATKLENKNINVNFRLPWGLPHSGDYDLAELMEWIDSIVSI